MAIIKTDYVALFALEFNKGISGLVECGKIYVKAIDEDYRQIEVFKKALPEFTPGTWRQFEDLGRGNIHYKTLLIGKNKRRIQAMPISTQKRIADGTRYELLLKNGDTLKVDLKEASIQQAKQLFDKDHIRTISEQKIWLSENKVCDNREDMPQTMPIICKKGKLVVIRPVILTKKQVQEILMQI